MCSNQKGDSIFVMHLTQRTQSSFFYLFSARFLGDDKVTADRERLGRSHE